MWVLVGTLLLCFWCVRGQYLENPIDNSVPVATVLQLDEDGTSGILNWTTGVPPQSPYIEYWEAASPKQRIRANASAYMFAVGNPTFQYQAHIQGLVKGRAYFVVASDFSTSQNFRTRSGMSHRVPFNAVPNERVGLGWLFPGLPDTPLVYDHLRVPQQVHLSLTNKSTWTVTWATIIPHTSPYVRAWPLVDGVWRRDLSITRPASPPANLTYGVDTPASCCGVRYYSHGTIPAPLPSTTYAYVVGGRYANMSYESVPAAFTTYPDTPEWFPRVAFVGDFGTYDGLVAPQLAQLANDGEVDMVVHIGDIAYDLPNNGGTMGDRFLQGIAPVASQVPYMVVPGNHDLGGPMGGNGSDYAARFTMPGTTRSMFWSLDVGVLHLVGYNSEALFSYRPGTDEQYLTQYNWLQADLAAARENQAVPWVIAFAHRPMYCGYSGYQDCCSELPKFSSRRGILRNGSYVHGLEELFNKYHVDMVVTGHVHSYERFWPVEDWQDRNGSASPYTDPSGPVHVIVGSSGTAEGDDPFSGPDSVTGKAVWPWTGNPLNISAFRTESRGLGYLSAHTAGSSNSLQWEYRGCGWSSCTGSVVDAITIVRHPPS
eukprot:Sspe_Gene.42284::Locus_20526_Transcript_1_1_Confidence_1.000_Length_2026::g.42284::m.42284